MTNAIIKTNLQDTLTLADYFVKSGFFKDVSQVAHAVVKIQAGQELGIPPFAAMTGINIIQGKVALGANIIATLIANDPRYAYQVVKSDNKVCEIQFYENGKPSGIASFTIQEAQEAQLTGKAVWKQYPSDMLFARAITRGARRYAPGIFGGSPIYTPEELGQDTDEDGYIETTARDVVQNHPPLEGEVKQAVSTKDLSKPASWPRIWLQTLTSKDYAKNEFDAAGMLMKSEIIRPETPLTPAHIGGYGKHYRAHRDEGATSEEAAAYADGKLKAYMEGDKKPAPAIVDASDMDDVEAGIDPRDGMPFGDK